MAKKFLASLLILAFTLLMQPIATAQLNADASLPPVSDWQGLRDLPAGKFVVVHTRQGKEIEGKFVDITGSKLNLAFGFDILGFEQRDIESVYQKKGPRKRWRITGAIIGAILGTAIAGPIALRMEANQVGPPSDASPAPLISALGTFGGGLAGHLIGRRIDRKAKGKLLYKSH